MAKKGTNVGTKAWINAATPSPLEKDMCQNISLDMPFSIATSDQFDCLQNPVTYNNYVSEYDLEEQNKVKKCQKSNNKGKKMDV